EAVQHFRDARAACDELFVRHGESGGTVENEENEETEVKIAEKMPQLQVMLRRASQEGAWKAKAFFRRGLAKEKLQYLADAIEDFEAAQRLEPADTTVAKQLKQLRSRQRKAELDPAKMFKGILQREREEREKEEAAADLAARKQRREERLKAQAAQAAEAAEDGEPKLHCFRYVLWPESLEPKSISCQWHDPKGIRGINTQVDESSDESKRLAPATWHVALRPPEVDAEPAEQRCSELRKRTILRPAPESHKGTKDKEVVLNADAAGYFWRLALEMVAAPPPEDIGPEEVPPDGTHGECGAATPALRRNEALVSNFWELRWNILASSGFSAQPVSNLLAQVQGGPEAEAAFLEKSRAESSAQAKGHLLKEVGIPGELGEVPLGISRVYILYALAKQSQSLGAFKLARMAYDKLQVLRVPPTWQHQIDLACLSIRSKAYSDQDDLLPVCNWCMTTNPLLRSNLDSCINCGHPFIRTFLGFDILPLVEFQPETDISLEEAQRLIAQEPNRKSQSAGWALHGPTMCTSLDGHRPPIRDTAVPGTVRCAGPSGDDGGTDLFVQKMLDAASYFVPGEPYQPVKIDRETLADLRPEEVYTADFRRFSPLLPVRFFRSMIPEVAIAVCGACGNFFHQETWELEFLQNRCCPYCGSKKEMLMRAG
ncbi:Intraflagellar transport protein 122 homolog, partial [Durusdinium trenchii]